MARARFWVDTTFGSELFLVLILTASLVLLASVILGW